MSLSDKIVWGKRSVEQDVPIWLKVEDIKKEIKELKAKILVNQGIDIDGKDNFMEAKKRVREDIIRLIDQIFGKELSK